MVNSVNLLSHAILVSVCYQLFNNGSEVANTAHNTALFVHFKGQSSIIRSLGHILTCWEMAFTNLFTDGFNGAQKPYPIEVATLTSTCLLVPNYILWFFTTSCPKL